MRFLVFFWPDCWRKYRILFFSLICLEDIVADPDHACHFDVDPDPDPTSHFDADPYPSFQIMAENLEKVPK
jgi:hypothetical protein